MKFSTITTIYNGIYYLCSVRCSKSEISTFEGLTLLDNEPSFSFDKETYSDFKFNLTDDLLNHESLTKPTFDNCNALEKFVKTFCMFFKYSKIIHDDEFRTALSNFFEAFYKGDTFYDYSMVTVDNYLEILSAEIEEILRNKDLDCRPVLIEEVDGRIICKFNASYKPCNDGNSSRVSTSLKNKDCKDTVDFFMKFNELYLKGFFKSDLYNSLNDLNDEYFERIYDPNFIASEKFDQELFESYLKVHQNLQAINVGLYDEIEEANRIVIKLLHGNCLRKYAYKIIKRDGKRNIPKHLTETNIKVAAKVFFNMSENQDIFFPYSDEDKLTVPTLIKQIEKYFVGKNLSKESIDFLVTCCLEVKFY